MYSYEKRRVSKTGEVKTTWRYIAAHHAGKETIFYNAHCIMKNGKVVATARSKIAALNICDAMNVYTGGTI